MCRSLPMESLPAGTVPVRFHPLRFFRGALEIPDQYRFFLLSDYTIKKAYGVLKNQEKDIRRQITE